MKRFIQRAILTVSIALPNVAASQEGWIYVSQEGHQYRAKLNADGVVLESLYPVARFTGSGAMTQVITGIEALYLGRDCDAYSKVLGSGTWAWANGGFVARLESKEIWFPRQEIDANNDLNCALR